MCDSWCCHLRHPSQLDEGSVSSTIWFSKALSFFCQLHGDFLSPSHYQTDMAIDLFKQTIFWPLAHDTGVEKQSVRSAFGHLTKTLRAKVTRALALQTSANASPVERWLCSQGLTVVPWNVRDFTIRFISCTNPCSLFLFALYHSEKKKAGGSFENIIWEFVELYAWVHLRVLLPCTRW